MKKLLLIAACSFVSSFALTAQQLVSTLAGSTASGSANGTGSAATFQSPAGICVDLSGNVYVADMPNHLIRKITPAGVVTTLAGSGTGTLTNGTGTLASFYNPQGVCADGSGNIYVADSYNNVIRKITPAGVVTTYAGTGSPGSTDGPAASATFLNPTGLCCDLSGNIYVADEYSQKIRKISSTGSVTTVAGSGSIGFANGTGTLATFNYPGDVTVDISGNLYVADINNHSIRKITPAGVVTTLAGTGTSGNTDATGTAASFNSPGSVASDLSGNIFVGDYSNSRVRKITPAGVVTTVAGFPGSGFVDGNTTIAQFNHPFGIAVYTNGFIYVSDRFNNRIRLVSPCTAPTAPSVGDATVCAGSSTTLSATGTGTISWFSASTGGTAVATGTTFVTSNTLTAGTYTLYAEAATDCTVSASRTPVVITVSVCCTTPPAPVNTTPANYQTLVGYSATLTATSTETVNWYAAATGGTAIATGTAYVVSSFIAGSYTYYAEAANNCTVSATRTAVSFTVVVGEGINELSETQNSFIYPNPANALVTIASNNATAKTIEVLDVTGRVLMSATTSDATVQMNFSGLATGIYYVRIRSANATETHKIIKE